MQVQIEKVLLKIVNVKILIIKLMKTYLAQNVTIPVETVLVLHNAQVKMNINLILKLIHICKSRDCIRYIGNIANNNYYKLSI